MTTAEILNETFTQIAKTYDPSYEPGRSIPKLGTIDIDYALFDDSIKYNIDTDTFIAHTEFGCEGVYIGVFLEHDTLHVRVGTIKTLDEGCAAWQAMGGLAGSIMYLANCVVNWRLSRQHQE